MTVQPTTGVDTGVYRDFAVSPRGLIHFVADDPRGIDNYITTACGAWIDRSTWTSFRTRNNPLPEGNRCERCFR